VIPLSFRRSSFRNTWLTIASSMAFIAAIRRFCACFVDEAHAVGEPAVVLTFNPHPAVVFGGRSDFKYWATLEERAELLGSFGVRCGYHPDLPTRTGRPKTASVFMPATSLRRWICAPGHRLRYRPGARPEADATRLAEIGQELAIPSRLCGID